ncbi:hypothetical protein LTR64_008371 [Lithohypha guttulata]|uniref:uncharacterized protein n=1 Tax=Lithohypha guttulata TaxID=1690604 RepID=UPI00315C8B15
MSNVKTIVVTGANRGIGRAICELLISDSSLKSATLYAGSRRGEDLGLSASEGQKIHYPQLDITSSDSISQLAKTIQQAGNPIDIVINNAGVNLDDQFSFENAKKTMDTNYRGTLAVCRAFLPLMRKDTGRIVNLSSVGSSLGPFGSELQHRFRTMKSLDELESLAQEYENVVQSGKESQLGYPSRRSYSVSKACINAFTRILANENSGLAINCCCPGWVDTDMGHQVGQPPKTPQEGARIPVRLAVGDLEGNNGCYWANDSISSRANGHVKAW